jgi:cyclic pyranopterin phosphate synthase
MPVDVRFIEWMPFGGNKWDDKKFYSYERMLEKIQTTHPSFSRHHDGPNDTAKHWHVPG